MLKIQSERGEYPVVFHQRFPTVKKELMAWIESFAPSKVVVFTDSNVYSLYGEVLLSELRTMFQIEQIIFNGGEENKNLISLTQALNQIDQFKLDRKSLFIAFGGGVVGDMTGLLASIVLRGVCWVQVPTTLLSMVDSSVAGKTGINMPSGKNRIGSFYPPNFVISSTDVLSTLSPFEIQSGWGEILKHVVLGNSILRKRLDQILVLNTLMEFHNNHHFPLFIEQICSVKARVVEMDEHENGIRAVLNFGHTIGHALEKIMGYGSISHGQAVYLGMCIESLWLSSKGKTPISIVQYLFRMINKLDMSIEIVDTINAKIIFDAISFDKKMQCDKLKLIGFIDFGDPFILNIDTQSQMDLAEFTCECLSDLDEFFRIHQT